MGLDASMRLMGYPEREIRRIVGGLPGERVSSVFTEYADEFEKTAHPMSTLLNRAPSRIRMVEALTTPEVKARYERIRAEAGLQPIAIPAQEGRVEDERVAQVREVLDSFDDLDPRKRRAVSAAELVATLRRAIR